MIRQHNPILPSGLPAQSETAEHGARRSSQATSVTMGSKATVACADDSGKTELFDEILGAISESKEQIRRKIAKDDAALKKAMLEAERVAKQPPPPGSGGRFVPPNRTRIFSPCSPLYVPYYEPMKEQAVPRPARCSDWSASPAFVVADAVPRIFTADAPALPPCKRRPPFPGCVDIGSMPGPQSVRGDHQRQRSCSANGASGRSSAMKQSCNPKVAPEVEPAAEPPRAASAISDTAPSNARSSPAGLTMAAGRACNSRSLTPQVPRTPRMGTAVSARLHGVQVMRTPPPWCPGRATPSELQQRTCLHQHMERPKTSML